MRSRSSPKVRSFWRSIDSRDPFSGVNGKTMRRNLELRPRREEFTRAAMRREWWRRLLTAGRRLPDPSDCVDSTVLVVAVFTAGIAGCDINEMASAAAANIRGTVLSGFHYSSCYLHSRGCCAPHHLQLRVRDYMNLSSCPRYRRPVAARKLPT